MPPVILFAVLLLGGTAAILIGAALAYRRYLDHVEDWNPWAECATPALIGQHRLGAVPQPYRLPEWTTRRRLPALTLRLPGRPVAVVEGDTYREPEEGEIRELSTIG